MTNTSKKSIKKTKENGQAKLGDELHSVTTTKHSLQNTYTAFSSTTSKRNYLKKTKQPSSYNISKKLLKERVLER